MLEDDCRNRLTRVVNALGDDVGIWPIEPGVIDSGNQVFILRSVPALHFDPAPYLAVRVEGPM